MNGLYWRAMPTEDIFTRQLVALRPALHRYCARMTGSVVDGEDVLQEVLIKAVNARSLANPVDNFQGWLFPDCANWG